MREGRMADTSNQQAADRREFFIETASQGVFVFFPKRQTNFTWGIPEEREKQSARMTKPALWQAPVDLAHRKLDRKLGLLLRLLNRKDDLINNLFQNELFVCKWFGAISCAMFYISHVYGCDRSPVFLSFVTFDRKFLATLPCCPFPSSHL